MATRTYADLITSSLRLLGVKAQGQRATGAEAVDALAVLNELIDSWNSYTGLLYATTTATLPLTGASSYTIGPTGQIQSSSRPSKLVGAWVRDASGNDYSLNVLANSDYGNVSAKETTATQPTNIYLENGSPNSRIFLYPIGASVGSLILQFAAPLSEVELNTIETLPSAYRQALRFNLAVVLAPEYGIEPTPTVQMTALTSKSMIINSNVEVPMMSYTNEFAAFNISTGV